MAVGDRNRRSTGEGGFDTKECGGNEVELTSSQKEVAKKPRASVAEGGERRTVFVGIPHALQEFKGGIIQAVGLEIQGGGWGGGGGGGWVVLGH